MYKNWDMKQLSLKNMSEEETTQFFKDAKTFCGGSFAKGKVRALLEKKLIQYETNQVETKVRGKFLPLSVYEKKGYNTEHIEAKAERMKSDMLLGYSLATD